MIGWLFQHIQAVSDLTTPKELTKSRWSPNDNTGDLATPTYFKLGGSARSHHITSALATSYPTSTMAMA